MTDKPEAELPFDRTRVLSFSPGDFAAVHQRQRELVEQRATGETPDTILIGQHERVFTAGRGSGPLPTASPIPVHAIERGGKITWHGPGQIVGYPIVSLRDAGLGVREYLRVLETVLIEVLGRYEVAAKREEGATGVWIGDKKIASLGVAVRRGITYHGFALNVDADLSDFALIEPCGFSPQVMTTLAALLTEVPTHEEVTLRLVQALVRELGLAPPIWEREEIRRPTNEVD